MTLGQRIRQIRGGESQDTFANRLNINKNTLGFYERDERTPNATFVADICKQECIASDWLLYGEGPMRRGESVPATTPVPAQPEPPPADDDFKMSDMLTKTAEVLESGTIYRTALASNINAFHQAIRSERTLMRPEERMALLEQKMEELANENLELKRRLEQQDENNAKAVGAEG
jgi:transcriptional regulator with XRE-family HTH domain